MSIFSRLWRFVHTNGYPLLNSPIAPAPKSSRRQGTQHQRLEMMERRVLLSTIVGGQTFTYALPTANPTDVPELVEVHANGNIVAELVAAVRNSDGNLIFGNLSGVLGSGLAEGNGSVPVTEGAAGSATPQPYTNLDTGLTVRDPVHQIHIKGISSNSSGVTYAFNVFSQQPFPSNATLNYNTTINSNNTSTTSNNTLWDIQLLRIDNSTGKATFIADLTNQLETGGNNANPQNPVPVLGPTLGAIPQGRVAFLPDLLNASNVTIGGAAFNPVDGRLYFDVEFKPGNNNANITAIVGNGVTPGVGGNATLDVLMSIDPTAGNESAVINTLKYGNGDNIASLTVATAEANSLLETANGAFNITALTFQPLSPTSSTMWVYRSPAQGGTNANVAPDLETYDFPFAFGVGGALQPTNAFGVLEQGLPLTGVTGLAFIPSVSGVTGAQGGTFLWATSATTATLHRIDIGNPVGGNVISANWGTTLDLNQNPSGTDINGNTDGRNLIGLTWNAAVTDPFTESQGVLMSYDEGTKDIVFVSDTLRGSFGNDQLFAVYTNQSDINASITFQTYHVTQTSPFVSDLYSNNFTTDLGGLGRYQPSIGNLGGNANNQVPGDVGQALLGYYDAADIAVNNQFFGYLHQSGSLVGPVGILPSQYTTDLGGSPSSTLQPGLYVGYGVETPAANNGNILNDLLGNNYVGVHALSVSNFGLITAVNSSPKGADQLAFISPDGTIINNNLFSIYDASLNPVFGIQALAWGDVNLNGGQQLYAVHDLNDGNGPTLGTITVDFANGRAIFNPLGSLGIGGGRVKALAFFNRETALDPQHQGLYAIATGGTAGPSDSLIQINPLTGAAFNPVGSQIFTTNGNTVDTRSGVFDANGNFIIADMLTASLMDVSLVPDGNGNVLAGGVVQTPVGSITSTIGAIARNPVNNQFYAVDNETDSLTSGVGTNNSSILMKIKDFTNPLNLDVNLGSFLFDGTVTGRVFVSGTIDRFYAGWLITGDSSAGLDPNAATLSFANNFQVNGDAHHILSLASIGTDGTQTSTRGQPRFFTATEIIVGGKIGDILTDDEMAAHVVAGDAITVPNIKDGDPNSPIPMTEDQDYVAYLPGANGPDFAVRAGWGSGQLVWNTAQEAPFSNSNFNNVQYLGSVRNSVTGQPDVIHLSGTLWTANGANGPDATDFFGVSLLAGQTITVLLSGGALGIFDPDGRLISTTFSNFGSGFNRPMTITATMAGTYRVAVSENSNFSTSGGALTTIVGIPYTLNIVSSGTTLDYAIGGVVAGTNVLLNNSGAYSTGIEALTGNIGAVVAGQVSSPFGGDAPGGGAPRGGAGIAEGHNSGAGIANHNIMAPSTGFEFTGQSVITGYGNALVPKMDIAVHGGDLRTMFAGSIGYSAISTTGVTVGTYNFAPDIWVPNGSVGLIQTVGVSADGQTVDETTGEAAPGDVLAVQFGTAAGGNIQHVNAGPGGNIGGIFRTNKSIGVINGHNMPYGTSLTEFHADVDRRGADGFIDLIDLTGDMGGNANGTFTSGPAIETGPGGDVRFIHVLGNIEPDIIFGGAITTAPGDTRNDFFLHSPGPVSFTDDSGALVTLTPGFVNGPAQINPITGLPVVDPKTGLPVGTTVPGQLATRVYGIRGSGGVVIVDVQTNASLTIKTASASGAAQTGEVSNVEFAGTGIAMGVDPLTGLPVAPTNPITNRLVVPPAGTPMFTTLTVTGGRTDIFDINNTGANAVFPADTANNVVTTFNPNGGPITAANPGITLTPAYGVINALINNTGGDILNAELGDVGSISVSGGNIGSTFSHTGQQLVKTNAVFGTGAAGFGNTTFPFVDQHTGLIVGNVATVSAGKSIGNITFTGNVSNITTDLLNNRNAAVFYGVNGPIVVNGAVTANGTTVTNANGTITTIPPVIPAGLTGPLPNSLGTINIGNGILSSGSGPGAHAGIFANGTIGLVTGASDAVVRGTINSSTYIQSINIPNGSIIDAEVSVTGAYNETGIFPAPITLPSFGTITETPFFNIGSISLPGNGGILSSFFLAANIGPINVPTGFGILQSAFETTQGTIAGITAGGYGFRDNTVQADNVGSITATGKGDTPQFSTFNHNAQPTAYATFGGSSDVFLMTSAADLRLAITGDVFNGLLFLPPSASGRTTGAIELNYITGSGNLTSLSGYQLVNNLILFANSIGSINIGRGGVDPVGIGTLTPGSAGDVNNVISTGRLNSLTVQGNVQGLDLEVSGPITSINIGGSVFTPNVVNPLTGAVDMVSNFTAKGPNGDIGSFTVNGSFAGNLTAEGNIGTITIGTRTARPNSDNFTGNITILHNHGTVNALNVLNLFGAIVGGTLNIFGNVGTINVFRSLSGLTSNLVIHGDLSNISIGTDLAHNNYDFTGTLTVEGNLGNATVYGALNGMILVKGNANVTVISSRKGNTVGVGGGVDAEGVITNFTSTGGNVAGNITATNGIAKATINGGSLTGQMSSTFGNVSNVKISGALAGTLSAANGTITALTLGGAMNGKLQASSLTSLTIPGNVGGTISITNGASNLTLGSALLATGVIQAGWISSLKISGNDLGNVTSGPGLGTPTVFTVGGNLSGKANFSTPLSATISGSITASGSLATTNSLSNLAVSGVINGDVLVDGQVGTISASSISNATITGGFGINKISAPGGISNSIIQAGISRGDDQVLGDNDVNESPTMADIGTITTSNIRNSIIAAGGNIGTLKGTTMTYSSVSSGLVLASSSIAAVAADKSPLANTTELNAARANATLLHGNFTNAILNGSGLINSALTAGVSPGADGAFNFGHGASDDNVNSSITAGTSSFGTVSTAVNSASVVLAATGGGQGTKPRVLHYTLDNNPATSIVPNDPVTGTPVATATVGTAATFSLNGQVITVTITGGAGATVQMFDNPATTNVLDTLVINGGSTGAPVNVAVSTTGVGVLDIGRVLATDGTIVNSFAYNGYLVGDGSADPQLWINNDMTSFSVGGYGTNGGVATRWSGSIGGNVQNFSAGIQGTGKLRIGGVISNGTIGTSVGDATTITLGHVNPAQAGSITQIATDPTTNTTYAFSGGFIFPANVATGAVTHNPGLHTAFNNQTLSTLGGMDVSGTGQMYGVSTLYNQLPTRAVGAISASDNLHALAANSGGQLFAINTNPTTGVDQLVTIDAATGTMSTIGTLKDPFNHTYSNNFLALTFSPAGTLYGIVNDIDGTGARAAGMALVQIATTADPSTGVVNVLNPSSSTTASPGVPITIGGNPVTDPINAFTYGGTVGNNPFFWAVRRVGNVDVLDKISITNFTVPSTLTATDTPVGNIIVNGTALTHIVGIGLDEAGRLIGMDTNGGGTSDLVGINRTTPASSLYISTPGSIANNLSAFAVSPLGANFLTYGYNTSTTTGGTLYTNPGTVATLGLITPSTGTFIEIRALSQDMKGTPLVGNVNGVAVTKSGTTLIYAVTDKGTLAEYDQFGNLIGGKPLGAIVDPISGDQLFISRIALDNAGHLVGIDTTRNRLVLISTTATTRTINGESVSAVLGSQLTATGTVNSAEIVGLAFSPSAGVFIGFDGPNSNFVGILGTSPNALGGLTANSITNLNITGSVYNGSIMTTGSAGFGNITANGGGTFTGALLTRGSIGSFRRTGDFTGTLNASGNAGSIQIKGSVPAGGVIDVDGYAGSVAIAGNLAGSVLLGRAGSVSIGTIAPTGVLDVRRDVNGVSVGGFVAGDISLRSVNSLRTGLVVNGASVNISGDVGSLTLSNGEDVGATVLARGNVGTLTASGVISGVLAVRGNAGNVTINSMDNGILTVGRNINSLTAYGPINRSVISSGVWVGNDGIYNTADDVIYGGSISNAYFTGQFITSALLAGVLPRLGTTPDAINNIPITNRAYVGDPTSTNIADVDSAEAGGIQPSMLGKVTFAGGINPAGGSVAVAADGISTLAPAVGLSQKVLSNQNGQLAIVGIARVNDNEIDVAFNKPIDTASIAPANVKLTDPNGNTIGDVTYGYFLLNVGGGMQQSVLRITRATAFPTPTTVKLSNITDRVGPRSALQDFNQDGIVTGNPFAAPFVPITGVV